MAETKREIERKYESDESGLPDLTGVAGIEAVLDKGVAELDATYYDTPDGRLAAASITLRRRTGGSDAGWHLKFPVGPGVRDEVRAPLSPTLPRSLAGLVRSRVRDAELVPVVRLRSARDVRDLVDGEGRPLAEVSVDAVRAERLSGGAGVAQWSEIEVELADGVDPAFLDHVEKRLRKAGVRRSKSESKLARALTETAPGTETAVRTEAGKGKPGKGKPEKAEAPGKVDTKGKAGKPGKPDAKGKPGKPGKTAADTSRTAKTPSTPTPHLTPTPAPETAADHVLAYLRAQRDAIVALDPAVRQDEYDSVHRMRVATRRMRSAFRSFGKVLDRTVTDPVGDELKWLAGELGVDRDQEVLTERIAAGLDKLPRHLVAGPVRTRVRTWSHARRGGSRRRLIAVLDGKRYLTLLDKLDALVAEPPLAAKASGAPEKVIAAAVRKDFAKVAALVEDALAQPSSGPERDLALHEARKKAKRTRYSAEAAEQALGAPATAMVKAAKSLQNLLGDHQDSVMAREALREIAAQAHAAGENAFTYGLLYGREERRSAADEAELPGLWAEVRGGTGI
ncbi:CYTH and CHAD domain-containing protein [Streptomyces niveiscabiei]|uniref:CYTH and CHAD domain-containing protein n=1 Tax=Streptomyces niveiscabiei TaxID=164115 RepID=UPI0029BA3099|nr:CYTH and CHAD domain-containing protein [Streptomyces niveiscabiei]MDX3385617.1 CYTH and CHAD domain-containing protein [Streptomyces niveiscabiei]